MSAPIAFPHQGGKGILNVNTREDAAKAHLRVTAGNLEIGCPRNELKVVEGNRAPKAPAFGDQLS